MGENNTMSNLYVYLICSRNKDNKDIPKFKKRAKTILEYKENEDKVIEAFKNFAAKGVPGEQTRLYRSVNSRNEEKIREELIIRLLRDKPSMTQLNCTLASVAQQVQNRDESKWLFDFDVDNEEKVEDFIDGIYFIQDWIIMNCIRLLMVMQLLFRMVSTQENLWKSGKIMMSH